MVNKEILGEDCNEYMNGQYSDLDEAKQACKEDGNCSAIHDVHCGGDNIYYLCKNLDDVLKDSTTSCVHEKIIICM